MVPTIWEKIDLSGKTIDDFQLQAFLSHINAKNKTKWLSLAGCLNVDGRGLAPLRGSTVLENIDLRVRGSLPLSKGTLGFRFGESGLREDYVANILFSMLPEEQDLGAWLSEGKQMQLRRVAIRPMQFEEYNPALNRERYNPALRCFFQYHDTSRRFLPPLDPRNCTNNFCDLCFVQTCKSEEISCPKCNKHYCFECAMPPMCMECPRVLCQWCSNVVECAGCKKKSCAMHGYECCGGCDKVFCQECDESNLEHCMVCNEFYCTTECHRGVHS